MRIQISGCNRTTSSLFHNGSSSNEVGRGERGGRRAALMRVLFASMLALATSIGVATDRRRADTYHPPAEGQHAGGDAAGPAQPAPQPVAAADSAAAVPDPAARPAAGHPRDAAEHDAFRPGRRRYRRRRLRPTSRARSPSRRRERPVGPGDAGIRWWHPEPDRPGRVLSHCHDGSGGDARVPSDGAGVAEEYYGQLLPDDEPQPRRTSARSWARASPCS